MWNETYMLHTWVLTLTLRMKWWVGPLCWFDWCRVLDNLARHRGPKFISIFVLLSECCEGCCPCGLGLYYISHWFKNANGSDGSHFIYHFVFVHVLLHIFVLWWLHISSVPTLHIFMYKLINECYVCYPQYTSIVMLPHVHHNWLVINMAIGMRVFKRQGPLFEPRSFR